LFAYVSSAMTMGFRVLSSMLSIPLVMFGTAFAVMAARACA